MKKKLFYITAVVCLSISGNTISEEVSAKDYFDMSLEELMQIPITSVSKKEEKASQAPAAIFVITQDDIRRSGATSIPEALRLAPGVQVAKINSNKWAISAGVVTASSQINFLFL